PRAHARERRDHSGGDVRRAANHFEVLAGSRVDLAQVQALGIGMALDFQNLADHDANERRAYALDAFDLESGYAQAPAQLRRVGLDRNKILEPANRDLHRATRSSI